MTTGELKQRDKRWASWAYLGNQFREVSFAGFRNHIQRIEISLWDFGKRGASQMSALGGSKAFGIMAGKHSLTLAYLCVQIDIQPVTIYTCLLHFRYPKLPATYSQSFNLPFICLKSQIATKVVHAGKVL